MICNNNSVHKIIACWLHQLDGGHFVVDYVQTFVIMITLWYWRLYIFFYGTLYKNVLNFIVRLVAQSKLYATNYDMVCLRL